MADCDHDWRWNLRDRRWDCTRGCGTHAQGCGPCEGVGLEIIAKVAGIVVRPPRFALGQGGGAAFRQCRPHQLG